ncbi:MAG: murein hydrolase activator EnvC family protein [Faecalibacterium sp.]
MKRFLLWLVGVALGVAVLLAAVMGVSYSFTAEGSKPAGAAQFGAAELEANGSSWQVPLLGGMLDKVFTHPTTLTVQKLGVLYDAHPALTLPDWATYAPLTITDSAGRVIFDGTAGEYEEFLFPSNGEYKAELTVWRLPEGMTVLQFEGGETGSLRRNARLEHPARPTGYEHYSFRFTLQASAEILLSAERVEQGGVVGLLVTGMAGDVAPTVETDLGSVQCIRCTGGWRAYIPAAYNASAGAHEVAVTVQGEVQTRTLTVIPRDFGTAETEPEPAATEAAAAEYRNRIWPLYEQPARQKLWSGGFVCPAEDYMVLVDFGQVKVTNGQQGSRSNSTKLYTIPGEAVRAPAAGVVVLARELALTGNTVVIDHGCGVRSYLYGLQSITASEGQTVERGQSVGVLGEEMTMDFKLGSKSVNPWLLFQSSGGLFWKENL